jgi:hypothetical protein
MQLSHAQKQAFFEQGYVRIPGVVPPVMVQQALKAIHHSLGYEGIPPDQLVTLRSRSYCPEIQHSPVITDLLNKTPAWEYAESLVGTDNLQPVTSGQIALRFPVWQDPPTPPKPHIDGVHSPHNGVPEGVLWNFTMLASVLLSDVAESYAGNFTVWPGTHQLYEAYFRQKGPQSLIEGMPPIELPEPVQLTGKAGDVILAHYQLGHAAAMNVSHAIRYAIFFRLKHIHHDDAKWEVMTDIWKQWDGMRVFVSQ